ncbi:HNH endonuclease family protein [Microbispora sp. NBRC 16548]|uniref:HNH endonuclease family protein n=1 Tax=Microbispora sp. NBRC 16548 TaxID=3030994 RepID=UPI0024A27AE7|nr:HNH endonuclease family protein [Microbispora sp. NBRC 16548]GLX06800.1 hypothetical protein Misp03_37270 [Microbispora sp. NBRC 16548]
MSTRRALLAAIATLTLTLGAAFSPAMAAAPVARTSASAPDRHHRSGPLLWDAIASLPLSGEDRTGYKRSSFKHWIDADHDGCSTRAEVLIAEAVTPPQVGPGCTLTGGQWYSYYDDTTVDQASSLDVDHLVPLAEAWDSGAYAWTPAQREAYANDLDQPYHLVAVTARANRSKADKDPAEWLPPSESAWCRYIAEWTAVKINWGLTVDAAEKTALTTTAQDCPNSPLPDLADAS